jgi:RNase H
MLKCLGRLSSTRIGHSLVYDKMIKELPIIAAKTNMITHTNVYDRRFIVKFLTREFSMDRTENVLQNETIHIFTDGKAALMALSYKISSSIVMQCWISLQTLSTLKRVCLSWVPGHCSITGNEMADKLARGILCANPGSFDSKNARIW